MKLDSGGGRGAKIFVGKHRPIRRAVEMLVRFGSQRCQSVAGPYGVLPHRYLPPSLGRGGRRAVPVSESNAARELHPNERA